MVKQTGIYTYLYSIYVYTYTYIEIGIYVDIYYNLILVILFHPQFNSSAIPFTISPTLNLIPTSRTNDHMLEHPVFTGGQAVDHVYLDNTYLNPQYVLPSRVCNTMSLSLAAG